MQVIKGKMIHIKRSFYLLAIFALGGFLLFIIFPPRRLSSRFMQIGHQNLSYAIDTQSCKIPFWNPFDPTIVQFYEKITDPKKCPEKPSFLYVRSNDQVQINETILKEFYHTEPDDVECSYQFIFRDPDAPEKEKDDRFILGPATVLLFGKSYENDFMLVNCFDFNHDKILTDYIYLIPNKPCIQEKLNARPQNPVPEPLNVLFLGLDSISKLNFIRHLPKTRKFLNETLEAIELHGYTKVGDNTFPNVTPMLTGHFVEHYWNESVRNSLYFDDLDLLWKEYSKKGYVTHYAEDAPKLSAFNYLKLGFQFPPTDFYYRPMTLAMEKSELKQKMIPQCFEIYMEFHRLLDYLRKLTESLKSPNLYFSFTFITHLTHDGLNNAGYADSPTLNLLRDLHTSGVLNRSVLFFFSDHGMRFEDIRKTYIGKFEERMPFAYLTFPPWFYTKYPQLSENLKANQRRLTSPFDIHATFQHLLHLDNYEGQYATGEYGRSLFKDIPSSRTCQDAGILPHWCTCHVHTKVNNDSKTVITAGNVIVDVINSWLVPQCLNFTLIQILDARLGTSNNEVFYDHQVNDEPVFGEKVSAPLDYLLTIEVRPGDAMFEATVRYSKVTQSFMVIDDISRINRYGNQSFCVTGSHMRKYCYCKDYVPP